MVKCQKRQKKLKQVGRRKKKQIQRKKKTKSKTAKKSQRGGKMSAQNKQVITQAITAAVRHFKKPENRRTLGAISKALPFKPSVDGFMQMLFPF